MIKKFLHQYKNNPKLRQVISLLSVNVIVIPLSVVSSMIITRFLGPVAYGDYKFLLNLFSLAVVIFSFGYFQAGNRALVLNNDIQKAKEIYGAELIITAILFLIMTAFLCAYALVDHNIIEKGLRKTLLLLIPFSWVFLLVKYFEVLFQADNKIKLLAKSRLYPQLGYFTSILIIYLFIFHYSGNKLAIIMAAYLLTQILAFSYIIYVINPSFKNLKRRIKEILVYNRSYGFNVYLGSVLAVGFSQLTGLLISYFASDNSGVGYFSLATTIAGPLSFIPNVIATTHYKDFSTSKQVPRKLFMTTIIVSGAALILCWLLVKPFIKYFYTPEFSPVIPLTYIVSIGIILNGVADFFNRFLGSHGKGKALRNSAFIVGFCLMIFNILLIPRFGETGAAWTLLLSGVVYFISIYWYYRKLMPSFNSTK